MLIRCMRRSALGLVIFALIGMSACERTEHVVEEPKAGAAEEAEWSLQVKLHESELRSVLEQLRVTSSHPRVVKVYTIANGFDSDFARVRASTHDRVAGYPVRQQVMISSDRIRPLIALLVDRKTYFPPDDGWTCMFEPHHVVEMISAKQEKVTLVICVQCGDVEIIFGTTSRGTRSILPQAGGELSRILDTLIAPPVVTPRT